MTSLPGTIPQVLDRIADQFSEHDALVTTDRRLTFAELRDEVRRAAAAIVDMGVRAGDRVAIWSPNTWHWVVACLATTYAGGVLVPLNTRYTAGEATDILAAENLVAVPGQDYSRDVAAGLAIGTKLSPFATNNAGMIAGGSRVSSALAASRPTPRPMFMARYRRPKASRRWSAVTSCAVNGETELDEIPRPTPATTATARIATSPRVRLRAA